MFDVRTNFYTTTYPATGTVEHGTFHVADVLNGSDGNGTNIVLLMTNSIVSEVSSLGNGYSTNSDSIAVVSTNVFQTVGAGAHYLESGSTLRNAGSSNIDPALMLSLKSKT